MEANKQSPLSDQETKAYLALFAGIPAKKDTKFDADEKPSVEDITSRF